MVTYNKHFFTLRNDFEERYHPLNVHVQMFDVLYIAHVKQSLGGVMVSVFASSAVDRGFEPKTIKLVFVATPLSTQH
jgi:hypothetical protein